MTLPRGRADALNFLRQEAVALSPTAAPHPHPSTPTPTPPPRPRCHPQLSPFPDTGLASWPALTEGSRSNPAFKTPVSFHCLFGGLRPPCCH